MDPATRARIQAEIDRDPVVLFMKGTRRAPQCGFSATVVQLLDGLVSDYHTVNVLSDAGIREGVKAFSDWPTIPQLYVKGEFIGGCDIVKDLASKGKLEQVLGVTPQPVAVPKVELAAGAAAAFKDALQEAGDFVRVEIDADFNHGLSVGPRQTSDIEVLASGITLLFDRTSARRADGLRIDFVDTEDGQAFKIENPNEPARVKRASVEQLKAALDAGKVELFDVRNDSERELALIQGSRLLDAETDAYIRNLPKQTPLYFQCHTGRRSLVAAQRYIELGFRDVYNVEGGIEAWSSRIDKSVPHY
jgi:monothiol glutaredoxin